MTGLQDLRLDDRLVNTPLPSAVLTLLQLMKVPRLFAIPATKSSELEGREARRPSLTSIGSSCRSKCQIERLQSAFGRLPWVKDWIAAGADIPADETAKRRLYLTAVKSTFMQRR